MANIYFNPSKNLFQVKSKRNDTYYNVSFDIRKRVWRCDCWWYANRTMPNMDRWGYCEHIKRVLTEFKGK